MAWPFTRGEKAFWQRSMPWGEPSPREQFVLTLRRWLGSNNSLVVAAAFALVFAWLLQRIVDDGASDRQRVTREARLRHFSRPNARRHHRSPHRAAPLDGGGETATSNWMMDPARYMAPADTADHVLQVHGEQVLVRDGGYQPQPAVALLDTGNSAMTVIDEAFARRHALYVPPGTGSVFAEPLEFTTLRGINPGAETRAPVVSVSLSLRGRDFKLPCAISPLPGAHDILIGLDVLRPLFAEGFVLAR